MAEFALIAATGLSVGSSLIGASSQASAMRAQGEFQSQQAESQARLSDIQAESAIIRGKTSADETKTKAKLLIGRQRASLAAQGIEIDSGSALDIQLETAEFGAADALTIENNAFREATGHRIQAIDTRSQGEFAKSGAESSARNTLLTGGLNAASSAFNGYSKFKDLKT